MATKPFSMSAPSTPPETDLQLRSQAPGARALPPSPPFTPAHDREQQQWHLETTSTNIDRILQFLTRHPIEGQQNALNTSATFDLPQSQLVELERCLHAEGWEEKVRYDYDGTIEEAQLCLRMPSVIHEHFTQAVADEIQKGLAGLVDRFSSYDKRAALETRKVWKSGSTTLEFEEPALIDCDEKDDTGSKIVRRSPDASFTHESTGAQAPGLVIEVGYSQQSNKLACLADSYITNSRHKIRCVIAFDIVYHSPKQTGSGRDKTARLSLWRPGVEQHEEGDIGICMPIMEAVPFRDGKGLVCDGSLDLSISDFLRPSLCKTFSAEANQESITISFTTLARLLDKAETCSVSRAESEDDTPKVFRRKRKRSPPEQLSSPREKAFANLELEDSAKERNIDVDWPGSSKRRSLPGGHLPKLGRSSRNRNSDNAVEDLI
jgi:hypothetical protein